MLWVLYGCALLLRARRADAFFAAYATLPPGLRRQQRPPSVVVAVKASVKMGESVLPASRSEGREGERLDWPLQGHRELRDFTRLDLNFEGNATAACIHAISERTP